MGGEDRDNSLHLSAAISRCSLKAVNQYLEDRNHEGVGREVGKHLDPKVTEVMPTYMNQ